MLPVHNRKSLTLGCLSSLKGSRHDDFNLKAIVVDDGSSDGTAEAVAKEHPEAEVLHGDGSLWWSGGMNLGVHRALELGADWVLCINDDTLFDADMVATLVRESRACPKALLAPRGVLDDTGETVHSGYVFVPGRGYTALHKLGPCPDRPYRVETLPGYCVLVPADVYRRVGLYDAAHLPQYHADLEFCVRAGRYGFPCWVVPDAELRIARNLKNPDLLRDVLKWKNLRYMFGWPQGVYAPKAYIAFCWLTHPAGPVVGVLHAAFFYLKAVTKIALNPWFRLFADRRQP